MTCKCCFGEKYILEACFPRVCFSELDYVYGLTCSVFRIGKMPFYFLLLSEARAKTKAGMRPTLPASLPTFLSFLIERCWDTDASTRPPFLEICAELRRVKYLLMSVDATAASEKWEQGQLGVGMSTEVGADEMLVGQLGVGMSTEVGADEKSAGQLSVRMSTEVAVDEKPVGQLGVGMSTEVGADEKPVGQLGVGMSTEVGSDEKPVGQLGVGMSTEVGVDEKPIGQLGGHVSKNEQAVGQIGETPIITIGWRIAFEESAVEFFFPSAESMSRIVGVGLEFAKVVVTLNNLEVKIVGIGQKSWEAVLPKFTTVDKKLEVARIATANMRGPGSQKNPTFNAFLTSKKSAQKYGVGLCSGNTIHVQSTDVPHESNYCMVLHELVEYLMLMNVDLAKIGNQCVRRDGAGSSSSGGNKSNQANRGDCQIRQKTSYFPLWWSKGKSKSIPDDDEDDDDISPSKRQPQEEEHETAQKKKCAITVLPGLGGSFWNTEGRELHEAPAQLNDASIVPKLVFEFDMNGKFGKQIFVTTTTLDLGNSALRRQFRDSFGWYHNPLMTSLRNQHRDARLRRSDLVMGITKAGKLVLRETQTCSNNDALRMGVDAQIGFHDTHIGGSFTRNRTIGKTFAREEGYENCTSLDVWKGFIYQDLSAKMRSSAEYEFTYNLPSPLPLAVLEDSNEKLKYLGSGMCGKMEATFVGVWGIKPEDTNTASKYVFDAQRTLNELSKINGETRLPKTF